MAERIRHWTQVGKASEHLLRLTETESNIERGKRALVIEWGELNESPSQAANSTALRNLAINASARNLLMVFVSQSLQQLPRWVRNQTVKLCSPCRTLIPELTSSDLTHLKDLISPAAMSRLEILCAYPDAVPSRELFRFVAIVIDHTAVWDGSLVWTIVPCVK